MQISLLDGKLKIEFDETETANLKNLLNPPIVQPPVTLPPTNPPPDKSFWWTTIGEGAVRGNWFVLQTFTNTD